MNKSSASRSRSRSSRSPRRNKTSHKSKRRTNSSETRSPSKDKLRKGRHERRYYDNIDDQIMEGRFRERTERRQNLKRASIWEFESDDNEYQREIEEIKAKNRKEIQELKKNGKHDVYAWEDEEDKEKAGDREVKPSFKEQLLEERQAQGKRKKKESRSRSRSSSRSRSRSRSQSKSRSETDEENTRDKKRDRKDSKKKNKEKKEKKEKKRDKKDKKDKKDRKDKKEKRDKKEKKDKKKDKDKKAKKIEKSSEEQENEQEDEKKPVALNFQQNIQFIRNKEESEEEIIGPKPPAKERTDLNEDGSEEDQEMSRRTDPTYTNQQIQQYENLGYVMSGARNKKLKELREKKEGKLPTPEEKKAIMALSIEQKAEKEKQILANMTQLLQSRNKGKKKE